MGRRRHARGRPVSGILLLDKPLGLSSNHALQRVKRLYGARKAGHTGSLDPLADGMLPICLGEASKTAAFMLDADKTYEARARLGVATDTGDIEGTAVREAPAVPRSVPCSVPRRRARPTVASAGAPSGSSRGRSRLTTPQMPHISRLPFRPPAPGPRRPGIRAPLPPVSAKGAR